MYLLVAILLALCFGRAVGHQDGFSLGIRDSIMIAHSFTEEFGPAHNMHGATYTVDVEFSRGNKLVKGSNWVIDIGEASDLLAEVLKEYNFKNLNELFPTENTTTEFMCKVIHGDMCDKLKTKDWRGSLSVKLHESHKAWASYSSAVK